MAHDHAGHSHGAGHVHGDTSNKTRVLWAAILTGGFMIAEAVGGLLTGSLALLADAGHMLTDSVALWLAWYAFKLAERPATQWHSYGLGRVKTLVAYTNGLTIFVVAAWICYEAVRRFFEPAPILGGPMLAVAVAGLLVNIAGFFILNGGDRTNLNMRGAILHVLGDMLGSAAAIVAALIIIFTGWTPIDPILSVLVAVLILSTAWSLMRDAARVLIEGTPPDMDRAAISADIVANVANVRDLHHVHIWSIDGSRTIATMHACVADGADPVKVVGEIKSAHGGKAWHRPCDGRAGVWRVCRYPRRAHDHGDHEHDRHDHGHEHSGAHGGHRH